MSNTNYVQAQKFTLSGSGCTSTATSIILASFKLPDGSTDIAMTDFGDKGFGTLEPGTSREEQISFTGVTQNINGTATLTGVTRGVRFVSPYDSVSANKFSHTGGATFVISNTSGFYNEITAKDNSETITGTWTFAVTPVITNAPVAQTDAANKDYIDGVAIAGSPNSSTTVKGISKLSAAPTSATDPIAVGDNDTRIPTQGENDALVGTSGTAVSSSNKLIDAADATTAKTASKIARRDSNGDVLVSTTPTNADAATSKTYTDTKSLRYIQGVASYTANTSSTTTTIVTGFRPKIIMVNANCGTSAASSNSGGSWNATNGNMCSYTNIDDSGISTTYIFNVNKTNNGYYVRGLVNNVTATGFDLVVTTDGSSSIVGHLEWSVIGQE